MEHIRPGAHVPEEAVLVSHVRGRAHRVAARALVQLVHARVRGAGDVERGGPVQVELRVLVYVREEGVRVEEACKQGAYSES